MKKINKLIVLMFIAFSSFITVNAVVKPNSDFYLLDQANIFSESQKNEIINSSYQINEQTGAQIVMVTVKSLDNMSIENYAYDLFNEWQIGSKNDDNGLLILFAPNEREYRLMSGPGLEDIYTARYLGTVRDDVLLPGLKSGNYADALMSTYNTLVSRLSDKYPNLSITPLTVVNYPSGNNQNSVGSLISEMIWMLIAFSVFGSFAIFLMPRRRRGYNRHRSPYYGGSYNRGRTTSRPRSYSRGGGGRSFGGGVGGKF